MLQPHDPAKPGGKALIALGGNVTSQQGGPLETVKIALDKLDDGPLSVLAQSRLFQTPCFPAGAGPDYVNAVALVETGLSPEALLAHLHELEADFGRERGARWASRTLDLDLVLMDQRMRPDQSTLREWVELPAHEQTRIAPKTLILPHPRLQDRAFVLVPAAEVWPDWRHPLLGRTIAEMRDALPAAARAEVVALAC